MTNSIHINEVYIAPITHGYISISLAAPGVFLIIRLVICIGIKSDPLCSNICLQGCPDGLDPQFPVFGLLGCPGGGGGGTQVQKGAAPSLRISQKKGSFFKTSACPRFCKRRVLFVPRYEVWGSKSPYNPRNIRGSDAE